MRLAQIVESLDLHMPEKSCAFRYGDCSIEVLRVVKRALNSGFKDFIIVDGMVEVTGLESADADYTMSNDGQSKIIAHTWIELGNGQIKDPTISQFEGADVKYNPPGEFREAYSPEEFLDTYEDQYGISPSEVY